MSLRALVVLTMICAILLLGRFVYPGPVEFVSRTLSVDGRDHTYRVFVPPQWSSRTSWPIILYLHGAGERGTDGLRQTEVGLGPAIRQHPERIRAVVVMPQCPRGVRWNEPEIERYVLASLDRTVLEFNGDPNRLYLTGISMGGYGTFYLAARYPGKFAAIAPVCGGVVPPWGRSGVPTPDPYRDAAYRIGPTPAWVFHGSEDPVVPVSESRRMVEAMRNTGASVKYTEFPGVGHNAWDATYAEPDFFTWLLSQHR